MNAPFKRHAPTDEILTRRAPATRTSWDPETRTLDVIVSTFADVKRFSFIERLSRDPKDWDLSRVNSPAGVPVLTGHNTGSPSAKIGRVLTVKVEKNAVRATVKLSRNETADALVRDVQDGIGVAISFGYSVAKFDRFAPERDGDLELRIARGIRIIEISAVNVAADPGASVRANPENETMPPETEELDDAPVIEQPQRTEPAQPETRTFGAAERRALAERHGLGETFYRAHARAPERQYREAVLGELERRSQEQPTFPHVDITAHDRREDPEVRVRAMGEALYHRIRPSHAVSEEARDFVGLTIPEIARRCLEFRGESTRGMAPSALVTRALGVGSHTTSDFAGILGDTVGRSLRAAYEAAPSAVKRLARQTSAPDFRQKHSLSLSEGPKLEKVGETGEFRHGTFEESKESYKVDTFGKIFGISRQALINDNLGAFDQVPRKLGQAASAFEAQHLVSLIASNPVMGDGKALFHEDHKNLDDTGAAIDVTSLGAARTAMRKQVGLTGELISVTPKFLLVPSELETVAEQVLSEIAAAKVADANPFAKKLELIVEPRFADPLAWFVVADWSEIDGLEYAYLEGFEGPHIESRSGFEIDGVQIRVRLDFGGGFTEWRSWYRNDGAEPNGGGGGG